MLPLEAPATTKTKTKKKSPPPLAPVAFFWRHLTMLEGRMSANNVTKECHDHRNRTEGQRKPDRVLLFI
jgi:hypothetical protein